MDMTIRLGVSTLLGILPPSCIRLKEDACSKEDTMTATYLGSRLGVVPKGYRGNETPSDHQLVDPDPGQTIMKSIFESIC